MLASMSALRLARIAVLGVLGAVAIVWLSAAALALFVSSDGCASLLGTGVCDGCVSVLGLELCP